MLDSFKRKNENKTPQKLCLYIFNKPIQQGLI